ncbi:sensor domain-containing protein, partial [Streptomyces griseoaurantiacus]
RARVLLGAALADPPPPSGGPWRALGDGRRWRELLYLLLALPLGASQGVVVLLLGAMAARGVSYPFVMWGVDLSTAWGGPTWTGAVLVHSGLGVLAILASPWLLRLVTDAHGWVARRLL